MKEYYITIDGDVRLVGSLYSDRPAFDLEKIGILNSFYDKEDAILMRDIIEGRFPKAFHERT